MPSPNPAPRPSTPPIRTARRVARRWFFCADVRGCPNFAASRRAVPRWRACLRPGGPRDRVERAAVIAATRRSDRVRQGAGRGAGRDQRERPPGAAGCGGTSVVPPTSLRTASNPACADARGSRHAAAAFARDRGKERREQQAGRQQLAERPQLLVENRIVGEGKCVASGSRKTSNRLMVAMSATRSTRMPKWRARSGSPRGRGHWLAGPARS